MALEKGEVPPALVGKDVRQKVVAVHGRHKHMAGSFGNKVFQVTYRHS